MQRTILKVFLKNQSKIKYLHHALEKIKFQIDKFCWKLRRRGGMKMFSHTLDRVVQEKLTNGPITPKSYM